MHADGSDRAGGSRRTSPFANLLTPVRLVPLTFLGAIAVGAVLLRLPISHAPGREVGFLDALFTATSAVCVTGLAVVDTGSDYSLYGQTVILLLIQLGGLGVLTFGTILAIATGRRIGLGDRLRAQQQVSTLDPGGIVQLIRKIVLIVVIAELVGAVLLYLRFAGDDGPLAGAFSAVFHSVSAFNNAGFGLYSDNLTRYVADPLVNLTVIALIVAGGLGYIVILEIGTRLRTRARGGERTQMSLHSKMVLAITGVLIFGGMVVLLVFEWNNPATLGELSVPAKVQAALFASVTPRTAGFNTLDYGQMLPASLLFTMLLMFIGGSPGSTAGGVKTLTFYVMAASIWAVIRGRAETTVFGRTLPTETVVRAGAISFGVVMTAGAALTLLVLIDHDLPFLALMFEVMSAVGTTGLSMGITDAVGAAGKWILIVVMYLGRIGFLAFALALVERQPVRGIRYLPEEVVIG